MQELLHKLRDMIYYACAGFMCLPDDEIAGNMAMLDQRLALQWVQDHIVHFGGDPTKYATKTLF
jgi:hypothetical protein